MNLRQIISILGLSAVAFIGATAQGEVVSEFATDSTKVVIDFLVNEHGISRDRLIQEANGGVENMYYDDPRCSRAVISRVAIK